MLEAKLAERIKAVAADFERDGYAFVDDFLTEEEVEDLRKESLRLIKEEARKEREKQIFGQEYYMKSKYFINSGDKVSYFYETAAFNLETKELQIPEEQSIAKIAHAIHAYNPTFKKHTFSDKVKECFKTIGFEDPRVVQSMVIFKNPKVGGEYMPHQDAAYLCVEPPQKRVAGIWLALDDATAENGCLEFIPGSHKTGLPRRFVRTGKEGDDEQLVEWTAPPVEEWNSGNFVACPVKKGGMVMLDGLVVHRSAPNNSDKSRWIYTFHVYDKNRADWCKDNWLQPTNPTETFLPIYAQ